MITASFDVIALLLMATVVVAMATFPDAATFVTSSCASNEIVVAVAVVMVCLPSKPAPTPATSMTLPAAKPWPDGTVTVATLLVIALFVTEVVPGVRVTDPVVLPDAMADDSAGRRNVIVVVLGSEYTSHVPSKSASFAPVMSTTMVFPTLNP